MPFKTNTRAAHAAVQVPPAVADRAPHRAFRERGHAGTFTFDLPFCGFRHDDNLPVFMRRANKCSPQATAKKPQAVGSGIFSIGYFAPMKLQIQTVACVLGMLTVAAFINTLALADDQAMPVATTTNSPVAPDTRYGLFNWLDHHSSYGQGVFPEPFLVDDSDLEVNEARLDWLHTEAHAQQSDTVTAEVEKGFGNLTLEIEVPYERDAAAGENTEQGIGNIDLGARYPLYEYAAANDFFDTTFGTAVEVGIPVNSAVSKNAEFVPKVFNDLRVGEHFTLQSIVGYSTLFGGGDDGGLQTFEYGFTFGYTIPHSELPLPGVQQLIPVFELAGATELNKDDPGHDSLLGNIGFRANLKTIGSVQPRLGLGFVFPIDSGAHDEVHWGVVTSLVFEY